MAQGVSDRLLNVRELRMSPRPGARNFLFPLIKPALPAPEKWLPFLQESYEQHWFSNFGPAVGRLEAALAAEYGEVDDVFVLTSSAAAALAGNSPRASARSAHVSSSTFIARPWAIRHLQAAPSAGSRGRT